MSSMREFEPQGVANISWAYASLERPLSPGLRAALEAAAVRPVARQTTEAEEEEGEEEGEGEAVGAVTVITCRRRLSDSNRTS